MYHTIMSEQWLCELHQDELARVLGRMSQEHFDMAMAIIFNRHPNMAHVRCLLPRSQVERSHIGSFACHNALPCPLCTHVKFVFSPSHRPQLLQLGCSPW